MSGVVMVERKCGASFTGEEKKYLYGRVRSYDTTRGYIFYVLHDVGPAEGLGRTGYAGGSSSSLVRIELRNETMKIVI